jgi:hypothetical protein
MVSAAGLYDKELIGVNMTLINNDSGIVLSLPFAVGFELNPGVEKTVRTTVNPHGAEVPSSSYIGKRAATLKLTFKSGRTKPEIQEMIHAAKFVVQNNSNIKIAGKFLVSASGVAAVASGSAGYGAIADRAVGSILSPVTDLSVPLTRFPIASGANVFAATRTFAQGANLQFAFSGDLIGQIFSYVATLGTQSVPTLVDTLPGFYSIFGNLINSDDYTIWAFECDFAEPNYKSTLKPGEDREITYDLYPPAGACLAYTLVYLGQVNNC